MTLLVFVLDDVEPGFIYHGVGLDMSCYTLVDLLERSLRIGLEASLCGDVKHGHLLLHGIDVEMPDLGRSRFTLRWDPWDVTVKNDNDVRFWDPWVGAVCQSKGA